MDTMNEQGIRQFLTGRAKELCFELQEEVSSTNTVLRQEAVKGEPGGKVLIARRQTAGKGRRGRSFYSPEDTGLYMSLLLRPPLKAEDSLLITTAAAVAVAEAIERVTEQKTEIKWVNDVYCHGKKIVGILTEGGLAQGSEYLDYAVLGIGINLWQPQGGFPSEIASIAGSVLERAQSEEKKEEEQLLRCRLAAEVLNEFMEIYSQLPKTQFMDAYRKRSFLIGKTVSLMSADHERLPDWPEVKVVGIGDEAQLLVEKPDGTRCEIRSGQVSVKL